MPQWLLLIVVGLIIYGITYAPPFPPGWTRFAQYLGGIFILIGVLIAVLILLGVLSGPLFPAGA